MSTSKSSAITATLALLAVAQTAPAAVDFYLGNPVTLDGNDYGAWTPGAEPTSPPPSSATQIFHWGPQLNGNNSVRTLRYVGTDRFLITGVQVQADLARSTADGGPGWEGADGLLGSLWDDLRIIVSSPAGNGVTLNGFVDPFGDPYALVGNGGPVDVSSAANAYENLTDAARRVLPGQEMTVSFELDPDLWQDVEGVNLPNVRYSSDVLVTITGDVLDPSLGPLPTAPLVFAARAGMVSPSAAQTVTLTNDGDEGSLLIGDAAAPVGTSPAGNANFSGGGHFELDNLENPNPTASVDYAFTAAASLNGATGALVSEATSEVTTNSPDSGLITLQGKTVGPVFDFSGSDVPGATIDLGAFDPTDPALTQFLTVANLFDPGTEDYGSLTDLTLLNVGWTGTAGFDFLGLPTAGSVLPAQQSSAPFTLVFNPYGLSAGTYTATLTFETDEEAPNGVGQAGRTFSYSYRASVSPAPLPGTLLLMGAGLMALRTLGGRRRR